MFFALDSIKIINIETDYIKSLHDACDQVYYMPKYYDNKPYIGILISDGGRSYCIPLSSAKEKHKEFSDYDNGRFLVYENIDPSELKGNDIYKANADGSYKHILSILVIPKMIPIKSGVYHEVDINIKPEDSCELINYKKLLGKELGFCISNKERILKEANKIYDRQVSTRKVHRNYVDFKKLESVCDTYECINCTR